MAGKSKSAETECSEPELRPSELLAALSYLTDVVPNGCLWHSWRVGLVSEHIAASLCPEAARDVLYAGLLHDVGAVGSNKHITQYTSIREQIDDAYIRTHSQRSAALLNWLPGMGGAAQYVASHHEWWDGRGYPEGWSAEMIPLGSRIIRLVDAADMAGCFRSGSNLRGTLASIAGMTGSTWPQEVWAAFVRSMANGAFYRSIADPSELPAMIAGKVSEMAIPKELDNAEGVERVLHLFAALVDMKDPSTAGHSLRAARRAQSLAAVMQLSDDEVRMAYHAGLVHDCGRVGIETYILNKSGRLSEREMDVVRKHAEMTIRVFNCLPDSPSLAGLGQVAGHDHERYDGQGYPDKLSGEEIPLVSRIMSVVDAFDSMVSTNEYRLLTPKGAVVRIEQNAGTQFDPQIAAAMVSAVTSGVLDKTLKAA